MDHPLAGPSVQVLGFRERRRGTCPTLEIGGQPNTRATLESVAAGLQTRLTLARQRLESVCLSLILPRISFGQTSISTVLSFGFQSVCGRPRYVGGRRRLPARRTLASYQTNACRMRNPSAKICGPGCPSLGRAQNPANIATRRLACHTVSFSRGWGGGCAWPVGFSFSFGGGSVWASGFSRCFGLGSSGAVSVGLGCGLPKSFF